MLALCRLATAEALAIRFEDIGERTMRVARNASGTNTRTRTDRHVRLLAALVEDLADRQRGNGSGGGLLSTHYDGKPFTATDYRTGAAGATSRRPSEPGSFALDRTTCGRRG